MSARVDRAAELVELLTGAGISATADPTEVAGARPCVLIAPPRLVLAGRERHVAWPLYAVADSNAPTLHTWQQLDELVEAVDELLPIATATPASWSAVAGGDPVPAYLMTYEEAI